MTRINTNASSLNAQKSLARSNKALQQALTRLSTGLRINYGRDDPAGLIASEALRSDITSTAKAITNSERAAQMIATADSALGQVSSLLNDIRGLVTEAANTGAMSDDQISANQLQVDSSLSALNRIAQSTSFQGRRLLDGSLDFLSTAGTIATIEDIRIDQASLGTSGNIAVDVDITTAAAQGTITNSDGFTTAAAANETLTFAAGTNFTTTANSADLEIVSTGLTTNDGVVVVIDKSNDLGGASAGVQAASASFSGNTLTLFIDNSGGATTAQVATAVNLVSGFEARTITEADWAITDADTATLGQATLKVTAGVAGAQYNALGITVATQSGLGAANPTAVYDATANTLVITIDDDEATALSVLKTKIEAITNGSFTVATSTADDDARANINGLAIDTTEIGNTGGSGGGLLNDSLTIQVGGADGTEVFAFQSGASVNQMAAAINLVTDASGVAASYSGNTLTLTSSAYGTDAFVDVNVIEEGSSGTFEVNLSDTRDAGEDIVATVNGISATGDGNIFSINTATLSMTTTVSAGSSTNFDFNITGGGAMFQLGPDVVTNQQVRMGITSVNTATLRGESGRLYTIASGGANDLDSDPNTAARIVDQVINKVTTLRGRLGAFQKTSLDTNIASLTDTLENLTAAESSIRDADFAVETAALTRAQILVQSGISVLGVANSNPQNVLALLR